MSIMDNYLDTLKHELEARDGSFLIQMRTKLDWDREAFSQMVEAMRIYCDSHTEEDVIERWIASGFHYLSYAVKDWTMHPNFPQIYPPEYYQSAYQRLFDLACYLFDGISSYEAGAGFEPL